MPYIVFFCCLVLSGVFTAVFRRYGRKLLWVTCLSAGCVVLAVLFAIGWAHTEESPLWITILALNASVATMAGVVQALAERWALATVLIGALAGTIAMYVGILAGYVLWLYIG